MHSFVHSFNCFQVYLYILKHPANTFKLFIDCMQIKKEEPSRYYFKSTLYFVKKKTNNNNTFPKETKLKFKFSLQNIKWTLT